MGKGNIARPGLHAQPGKTDSQAPSEGCSLRPQYTEFVTEL